MPRFRVAVIFPVGILLAVLLATTRSVSVDRHLDVLGSFDELHTIQSAHGQELLALRYGLARNYDGLRAIEERGRELAHALLAAPSLLEGADGREMAAALERLQLELETQATLVDSYVSSNAMLNNALRSLPKAAEKLVTTSDDSLAAESRDEVEALLGFVYRYSMTGDEALRGKCETLLGELDRRSQGLPPQWGSRLGTVLFLSRIVIDQQDSVDAELRGILALDVGGRMRESRALYTRGHSRLQERVYATRWLLFGAFAALLAYVVYTMIHIDRLNASFERKVVDRTKELETSREQFRSLVETTRAIPWIWDGAKQCFTYVGPQASALLGCFQDDWLAPGFWMTRLHPDDRADFQAPGTDGKVSCPPRDGEFRLQHDDGRWVCLRSVGADVEGVDGQSQGILLDVTDQRRVELELRQAQKLESVGRLAAGVAHEINTPVQFVTDNVRFLEDAAGDLTDLLGKQRELRRCVSSGKLDEDLTEAVARIEDAEEAADLDYLLENIPQALGQSLEGLGRIATIVRSMKEFAHPDQKTMVAVDLNRAIESTLVIARNEYKYVAEIEKDLGDLPLVTCFGGDLNQAILNIVVNAAHAIADTVAGTSEKGTIRIRTRARDERVVLTISDTGGGIPEEIRASVFDPFFTTKGVGKGTGQGLAIARSIVVDKHRGELTLETEIGLGTTFEITLPIAGKAAAEAV